MRTALPKLFVYAAALPGLVGCSANLAASPDAVDADSKATSAVVIVSRTVSVADGAASKVGEAVARFVRMRSGDVDDDALRFVGATVDFPPLGTCGSAVAPASRTRAVELLDVGALSLEADGRRTNLQARQFPDVDDLVSGVMYSTQPTAADLLPPRADYVLTAAGSIDLDVSPFVVHASAPDEPQAVRIADRDVLASAVFGGGGGGGGGGGADGAAQPIELPEGEAVELTWAAGSPDDLVYVDIAGVASDVARPAADAQTSRCLFSDAGHATVAASAFGAGASGTITIHRLHSESFRVKGVDTGEVRFDFSLIVPYNLASSHP